MFDPNDFNPFEVPKSKFGLIICVIILFVFALVLLGVFQGS